MEEILASIRQTISAEKENGKAAAAERPAPPLFSRTNGVPRMGTPPAEPAPSSFGSARPHGSPQSLGRLSDALKAVSPASSNGLTSKRPSSFDDDLADILDEPSAGTNGLAPMPDVPGLFVPRAAEFPKASEPKTAPSSLSPFPSLSGDSAPAATDASAMDAVAKDTSTIPRAAPPMRRSGFYPPQGFMPALTTPAPSIEPARANEAAAQSKNPDGMIKRLTALGAVVPADPLASPAEEVSPSSGMDAAFAAAAPPLSVLGTDRLGAPEPVLAPAPSASVQAEAKPGLAEAKIEPQTFVPIVEGPRPGPLVAGLAHSIAATAEAEVPAAPAEPEIAEVIETPPSTAEIEAAIAEAVGAPEPIIDPAFHEPIVVESVLVEPFVPEPAPVPEPVEPVLGPAMNGAYTNGAYMNGAHVNGAHVNGARTAPPAPEAPVFAAKMALDALAQGLAASAAARPVPQAPVEPVPEPLRSDHPYGAPTGTLVPVSEANNLRHPGGMPPRAPVANSYDAHQPVRTLEDAVAEMLKPMLQQWLADNMPRIIEKALRVEAASTVKRNQKPPGY